MRPRLRSPFASLLPVLLMAALTATVGGCSRDAGTDAGGPTVTATGPDESGSPTEGTVDAPTDAEGTTDTPSSDLPEAVSAVCEPYTVMVEAIQTAAVTGADPDEIAARIAPVMKEFAAEVAELDRPPGMPEEVWDGVEALAERILALPDRPSDAEIEAVERQLSPEERGAVEAAAGWFKDNCVLG
ncbi:hypothetical protein [Nocardioides stalactiti]|uniref:hypothetical protein n=1 Tax=Nocardioides stalactiti TaxID=2755356 RepID=UPI0016028AB9|nr:hypothetical protein [Nocardioides stalactiti]